MSQFESNLRVCHKCEHRRRPCAGACPCSLDGLDIIQHARQGDCSIGRHAETDSLPQQRQPTPPASQPATSVPYIQLVGPAIWASIHTAEAPTLEFVRSITAAVPCGECRGHWLKILAAHPPAFSDEWFAWTVMVHNLVNARLGKTQMTEAEAMAKWRPVTA